MVRPCSVLLGLLCSSFWNRLSCPRMHATLQAKARSSYQDLTKREDVVMPYTYPYIISMLNSYK